MITDQAISHWQTHRRQLRRRWWIYLAIAVIGLYWFLHNLSQPADANLFAVLLLIPAIAGWRAWKIDRQIVICNAQLRPTINSKENDMSTTEKATFAAGCFWGVEEFFRKLPGVQKTRVGYIGGKNENPTYEQVCTGRTNHAEALEIEFDPSQVSFQTLLEAFFENHDPTTLNRQGPDAGTQYRSGVFFHSPEQEKAAEEEIEKRNTSGDYAHEVVTEVTPAGEFYSAEDYHQRYFQKRGANWSCHFGNGKKPGRAKATAH